MENLEGIDSISIRVNVLVNLRRLLAQEDTDGDNRITIEDRGKKRFQLKSVEGIWYEIAGTYRLSNLLQELAIAYNSGRKTVQISIDRLFEDQVSHLSRLIRDRFWDGLTRRIDAEGLSSIIEDEKAKNKATTNIYVPFADPVAFKYFNSLTKEYNSSLRVYQIPKKVTSEYVRSLEEEPGILSLALKKDEEGILRGVPFIVPGGRFNELYGWDSYFEILGLLEDRRIDLAQGIVDNLVYEIKHYGMILNANRTYYLTRSQPPFLTSMALAVYEALPKKNQTKNWLARVLTACIIEYNQVWMSSTKKTSTGLNRYHGLGIGIPPETEPDHFDAVFYPYAKQMEISIAEYRDRFHKKEIINKDLDLYFVHDRAMRESGHDTTYRLDNKAAHLNTVDLNSLLYKYEVDIGYMVENYFDNAFSWGRNTETSDVWLARGEKRKALMNELMWNEEKAQFFDYNFVTHEKEEYESATTFYPLWAGLATEKQAELLVNKALPTFEAPGGLVSSTEMSRGSISPLRPQRQWDYPYGWAPHQMMAWRGLYQYGYHIEAARLAYRWLYMITRDAADYNGIIPEKYDVVSRTHKVFVEYGNVGTKFDYITPAGFGWMNASFQVGLTYIDDRLRNHLISLRPPEWLFGGMKRFQNVCPY